MNIGFIEDTHLRGGTQIWVAEANKFFLDRGEETVILAPEGSFVAGECRKAGAQAFTYDYEKVVSKNTENKKIWTEALQACDVAVCTVHPQRDSFHCSIFAGECIKENNIDTVLIPKTGTIVPEYKREFYLPDESIRSTVIAITDFTYKYLIDSYQIPDSLTELIYQGTDVKRFTSNEERKRDSFKRYPLPENASPVLGNVGMFEERKGQVVLLEAISKLIKDPFPDLHLILVGEGPDEQMLKNKVREMGLDNNVTFFPFTREPMYVFERIDILVLSSLYKEGLPNVLLEAMSMNVPVISSKMAGVPEIVKDGETGYMVEPGKSGQLSGAISKLWSDKAAYKKISRNGRRLMEENFDKEVQFTKFLEYFHRITGK
ncbi:MAG: glycosyltransferase family 4 protein [Actinomycetia bacterium]|nr:glycosyltransferase family 4 protein [Actinomycetes bacterium]